MKFFVPCFRDRRGISEQAWLIVRAALREEGMDTTDRRVEALVAEIDGADHFIAVDHEAPWGGLTMLILESTEPNLFHICTLDHIRDEALPWSMRIDERWRVVDFDG